MKIRSICAVALVVLACLRAEATITFNIDALDLRTSGGSSLMPLGGQIFLVASPDGVFGGPTASAFASGDDVVLMRWTLSGTATRNPSDPQPGVGYFQGSVNFAVGGGVSSGNPVQLYWFPTLSESSTSPGADTTYGSYRSDAGLDGSAPWVVPGDPASVTLAFITQSVGGSNPDALGWANFTVAPVPEASNLITAGLALGFCAFRLFRRSRQK